MSAIIGIDPGINGSYSLCTLADPDLEPIFSVCADLPTMGDDAKRRINAAELFYQLQKMRPDRAVIERAGSMPDQGIASAFRYGRAVGAIESAVMCAGIPVTFIESRAWKKFYGLVGPDKEQSRQTAILRFPGAAHFFPLKKSHNLAESCLIAYYGAKVLT